MVYDASNVGTKNVAVYHLHKITTWIIFIVLPTALFIIGINMPRYTLMYQEPKPRVSKDGEQHQ